MSRSARRRASASSGVQPHRNWPTNWQVARSAAPHFAAVFEATATATLATADETARLLAPMGALQSAPGAAL